MYGHNKDKIYELYSLNEGYLGSVSTFNQYLLNFFELDENIDWFLLIFKERNIEKNEKVLSNLIFSFYSHHARQNPNINIQTFLHKILVSIKNDTIKLGYQKLYYLGVLSECIGRDLLNRIIDINKTDIGFKYLNEAQYYYKSMEDGKLLVQNIVDYINQIQKNYNGR